MAEVSSNQKPCCCDPHKKYQKELKLIALKVAFVDLACIVTALCLLWTYYGNHHTDTEEKDLLFAIGTTVGSFGVIQLIISALVVLAVSITYHVHNAHELHGKKEGKSKPAKPSKKGKK